jgi:glycosyltransferase involved in cell wall biosynthesis
MPVPCIIVPAHNEATTIAETLSALAPIGQSATAGQLIVACNGCTDGTEDIAQAAAPAARVLTIAERGKIGAINRALAEAGPGSVIVLDADIVVSPQCIAALASVLDQPGVMTASPQAQFDLGDAPWVVRAFYRAFARHPYLQQGVGGSGVYGLSAAGRAALGALPAVVADDQYVHCFFPLSAQRRVSLPGVHAVVRPPGSLHALLDTERRSRFGVDEVHQRLPGGEMSLSRAQTLRWLLGVALRQPIDSAVFLVIKAWATATAGRFRPGSRKGWTTLRN